MAELEKEMATHSSVFAWRIPGMGDPGGLPSMKKKKETASSQQLKDLHNLPLFPPVTFPLYSLYSTGASLFL